jgi:hypothetical protein
MTEPYLLRAMVERREDGKPLRRVVPGQDPWRDFAAVRIEDANDQEIGIDRIHVQAGKRDVPPCGDGEDRRNDGERYPVGGSGIFFRSQIFPLALKMASPIVQAVARRRKSRYSESMSSLRDLLSRLSPIAIPGDLLLLLRPARR